MISLSGYPVSTVLPQVINVLTYFLLALAIWWYGTRSDSWTPRSKVSGQLMILVGAYFLVLAFSQVLQFTNLIVLGPPVKSSFLDMLWERAGTTGAAVGAGVARAGMAIYCLATGFKDIDGLSMGDRLGIAEMDRHNELGDRE